MSAVEIEGYKIVKTLGVGGQATVYLAIQQGFDREVALKVMSPALAADPSFGERFIREAKIVAKLSHSRIVTVYDVGECSNFYYLAMEYIGGSDLKTLISKGIKYKEALVIVAKIAQALDFAHRKGYIHRDVKSENILFDEDMQPILTDFGIAKASNSSTQMTQTGKLIGTPEYMSPEQCRGKQLDGRSDLYSLGIILFEMLTRKVPFTGEDSVSVCIQHVTKPIPQLPARLNHLQWLIDILLAKNPQDRYQTGKEVAEAIHSYLTNGDIKHPKGGNSSSYKTKISSKPNETIEEDMFQNQDFELDDNYIIPERIQVKPEPKRRVLLLSITFILVIAAGFGYLKREVWIPKVIEKYDIVWLEGLLDSKPTKPRSEILKSSEKEASVESKTYQTKENNPNSEIEKLIQQADTLANYIPHELHDVRQALRILTTVKSLEPENPDIARIRKDIIDVALAEAVASAEKKLFDNANQWLELVAISDSNNDALLETKNKVSLLEKNHFETINAEQNAQKQLQNYLQQANEAIKNGRLSQPSENSALFYIQKISEINPDEPTIASLYQQVEQAYLVLIDNAIVSNEFNKAKTFLENIKQIPNHLTNIESRKALINSKQAKFQEATQKRRQKEKEIEAQRIAQKERENKLANPLVQLKLSSNLQAAAELVEQEKLVEPIGNNALEKYRAVIEIDSLNSEAKKGISDIEETITTNLELAIANQLVDISRKWFTKLKLFDAGHSRLNEFQSRLTELKESKKEEQKSTLDKNKIEGASTQDEDIKTSTQSIKKTKDIDGSNDSSTPEDEQSEHNNDDDKPIETNVVSIF